MAVCRPKKKIWRGKPASTEMASQIMQEKSCTLKNQGCGTKRSKSGRGEASVVLADRLGRRFLHKQSIPVRAYQGWRY